MQIDEQEKSDGPLLKIFKEFQMRKQREEQELIEKREAEELELKRKAEEENSKQDYQKLTQNSKMYQNIPNIIHGTPIFAVHSPQGAPNFAPKLVFGHLVNIATMVTVASVCYVTYLFLDSLHLDMLHKANQKTLEITSKILECAKQYQLNNCDSRAMDIPYMKPICQQWEACMQTDPNIVHKLGIFGEVVATFINSLVNPLTWKSLVNFVKLDGINSLVCYLLRVHCPDHQACFGRE